MKNILYLSILFAFTSCSLKTHYIQTGSKTFQKTEEKNILIFSKTPEKQYDVIGSVAVFAPNEIQLIKHLKIKASELGADAVIEVTLDKISSVSQATGASGVAIKFK